MGWLTKVLSYFGLCGWLIFAGTLSFQFLPIFWDAQAEAWQDNQDGTFSFDLSLTKVRHCAVVADLVSAIIKADGGQWYQVGASPWPKTNHAAFTRFTVRMTVQAPSTWGEPPPDQVGVRVTHVCGEGIVQSDIGPFPIPIRLTAR